MSTEPESTEQVSLRRAPKYGSFIGLGAFLGVIASVIVYLLTPVDTEFGAAATIGFLALILGGVGMTLGAVAALLFDRAFSKKASVVLAERTDQNDE